jgi:hypothetical protein
VLLWLQSTNLDEKKLHLVLEVAVALQGLWKAGNDTQVGAEYLLSHAEYAEPDAGLVLLDGVVLQVVEDLLERGRIVRRVHHAHRLQLQHRLQVRALRERQRLDDLRCVRLILYWHIHLLRCNVMKIVANEVCFHSRNLILFKYFRAFACL